MGNGNVTIEEFKEEKAKIEKDIDKMLSDFNEKYSPHEIEVKIGGVISLNKKQSFFTNIRVKF